eukprot:1161426-Rhodomonas_salina.1
MALVAAYPISVQETRYQPTQSQYRTAGASIPGPSTAYPIADAQCTRTTILRTIGARVYRAERGRRTNGDRTLRAGAGRRIVPVSTGHRIANE